MLTRLAFFVSANPTRFALLLGVAGGLVVRLCDAYLERKIRDRYRELHRREFPNDPNCPICHPPN